MPPIPTPFYSDWQFWTTVFAALAIALSQFPPIYLWFRPRRLEVEIHSRIQITHKVGNPNVGMYVSIRNTGGRELRIRSFKMTLTRDNSFSVTLPAESYFENPSSQSSALFAPFSLRPGETWAHRTWFLNFFDRATEKLYRARESALAGDIRRKLRARPEHDKHPVASEPALVAPLVELFNRLFVWEPGEYIAELVVDAEPGSASFSKKYRFTLYESDTAELKAHTDDYPFGGGLYVDRRTGVEVSLSQHGG